MKRNKFAAGALALALGLSAVAPSFADDDTKTQVAEFTYDYEKAREKFVAEWNKVRAAEDDVEAAKADEATAKANYERALERVAELEARYGKTPGSYADSAYQDELDRAVEERNAAKEKYEANTSGSFGNLPTYKYLTSKYENNLSKYIDKTVGLPAQEAQSEALKDIIAINERIAALENELEGLEDRRANLQSEVSRRLGDYNEAKNKRQVADKALASAEKAYKDAKDTLIGEGGSVEIINKAEKAGDINIVLNAEVEEDDDEEDDAPTQAELAELKAAIDEAKATLKAVEIVKDKAEKIAAKNEAYLNKLVAEAEELIEEGEATLKEYKYTASFSLFKTAYAAEGEGNKVTDLTKKIKDKNKELQDAIEIVDSEEDAPADDEGEKADDEGEKADDEGEKADDEGEKDDDADENKDGKTKVIKEETTKVVAPAKTNTTNRKAGNNAKTGVAGVAGVAGVLAAASVAYAASKKNN